MRTAIISDIHGNLSAFDAVLADLSAAAINRLICLGDVAATGPQPREVIERLRALNCPVVMGNADEWLLHPQPSATVDEDTRRFEAIDQWCISQLHPADLEFVRTFRPTIEIGLGGGSSLIAYHGSPRSNTEPILANLPDEAVKIALDGSQADVMAGGHTHIQMIRRYQTSLIINPGSVGLPYEQTGNTIHNPHWAEYAVIEAEAQHLSVMLKRVGYDIMPTIEAAKKGGMPHANWWIEGWGVPE